MNLKRFMAGALSAAMALGPVFSSTAAIAAPIEPDGIPVSARIAPNTETKLALSGNGSIVIKVDEEEKTIRMAGDITTITDKGGHVTTEKHEDCSYIITEEPDTEISIEAIPGEGHKIDVFEFLKADQSVENKVDAKDITFKTGDTLAIKAEFTEAGTVEDEPEADDSVRETESLTPVEADDAVAEIVSGAVEEEDKADTTEKTEDEESADDVDAEASEDKDIDTEDIINEFLGNDIVTDAVDQAVGTIEMTESDAMDLADDNVMTVEAVKDNVDINVTDEKGRDIDEGDVTYLAVDVDMGTSAEVNMTASHAIDTFFFDGTNQVTYHYSGSKLYYCAECHKSSTNEAYTTTSIDKFSTSSATDGEVMAAIAYVLANGAQIKGKPCVDPDYSVGKSYKHGGDWGHDYAVTQLAIWDVLHKYGVKDRSGLDAGNALSRYSSNGWGNSGDGWNSKHDKEVYEKALELSKDARSYGSKNSDLSISKAKKYKETDVALKGPTNTEMTLTDNNTNLISGNFKITTTDDSVPALNKMITISGNSNATAVVTDELDNGYKFKIKVPVSSVKSKQTITVTAETETTEATISMLDTVTAYNVEYAHQRLFFVGKGDVDTGTVSASVVAEPQTGSVKLTKSSSNTAITNNNACYSLAGAVYGVYESTANANSDKSRVGTLTTTASGATNTVEDLQMGTYYVKEVTAPKGYRKDNAVHTVSIEAGKTATVTVKDEPASDPIDWSIFKRSEFEGIVPSTHAKFKLEYFDNYTCSGTAKKSWEFETDDSGAVNVRTSKPISGGSLYLDVNNKPVLPLGSFRVTETVAPKGYKLNKNNSYTGTIKLNTSTNTTSIDWDSKTSEFIITSKEFLEGVIKVENPEEIPAIIQTVALDETTKDHVASMSIDAETGEPNYETTLIDTVHCEKLMPGREYKLTATLMVTPDSSEETSEASEVKIDDEVVTGTATFVANNDVMDIQVTYSKDTVYNADMTVNEEETAGDGLIKTESILGTKTVVYERLDYKRGDGQPVVVDHNDPEDDDQTIYIPTFETEAVDGQTKDHVGNAHETTIEDTIFYTNLLPGKEYTARGTLVYKDDFTDKDGVEHKAGETIQVNGADVTAEQKFTPDTKDGSVVVTFTLDASVLQGQTVVTFEKIYHENGLVGIHEDLTDENQTIWYPHIDTELKEEETGDHVGRSDEKVKLIDRVDMENLIVGKEYTVSGVVMDQKTGEPIVQDGEEVTCEKTFTAEEANMSIELEFYVNSSILEGTTVVVYEDLLHENPETGDKVVVTEHHDITDEDQSVHFPNLKTSLIDNDTKERISKASGTTTSIDTVIFRNLVKGMEYQVAGKLMKKVVAEDGTVTEEPYLDKDGKEIIAVRSFIAGEEEEGIKYMTEDELAQAEIDMEKAIEEANPYRTIEADETTAADEAIESEAGENEADASVTTEAEVAAGEDENADEQASDEQADTEETTGDQNSDEQTEEAAEAELTNVERTVNGTIDITFTYEIEGVEGATTVAFEELRHNNVLVAKHSDINDPAQTIEVPSVRTTAEDDLTKTHTGTVGQEVVVNDIVKYNHLLPEREYKIVGRLVNKETGEIVKEKNGEDVTVEKTFTSPALDAQATSGTWRFEDFTVEESGKVTVQDSERNEVGSVEIKAGELAEIKDVPYGTYTVTFETYTTNEAGEVDIDSREENMEFKNEAPSGYVSGEETISFTLDSSVLEGKTVVAFEDLLYKDLKIAIHADINDADQSIHYPNIYTTAVDGKTNNHIGTVSEKAEINDRVDYVNLLPNTEYTMKGTLMNKKTGDPVKNSAGNDVIVEQKFTTPESDKQTVNGSVTLNFKLDSTAMEANSVVVFETLICNDIEVAKHHDIDDEDQTVHYPKIETNAYDKNDSDKKVDAKKDIVVTDQVTYTNLIPGKKYKVQGRLMSKDTGKVLKVNGKEVTAEASFKAKKADGEILLDFKFDATGLSGDVVAFEKLLTNATPVDGRKDKNEVVIAKHEDIDDEAQTVTIVPIEPGKPGSPVQTGDFPYIPVFGGIAAAFVAAGVLLRRKTR